MGNLPSFCGCSSHLPVSLDVLWRLLDCVALCLSFSVLLPSGFSWLCCWFCVLNPSLLISETVIVDIVLVSLTSATLQIRFLLLMLIMEFLGGYTLFILRQKSSSPHLFALMVVGSILYWRQTHFFIMVFSFGILFGVVRGLCYLSHG